MVQYILLRIVKIIFTLFAVITVVFFLSRITGNPFEREFSDTGISEKQKQELMEHYGLDKPVIQQYFIYLRELIIHGNAGKSLSRGGIEVTTLYKNAFQMTLKLVLWAFILSPIIGIPLGIIGALKRNTLIGEGAMAIAFVGYAFPGFVIAIGLILIFSFKLGWLPSMGDSTIAHYILPVASLLVRRLATIARFTRSSMLDAMTQDYIRTARGKGLSERVVAYKHALRNSLIPVITKLGTEFISLLTGSLVIETIFSWPGFGFTIITAVQARDFPVIQFGVIITATIVVTVNLLVDILYGVVDPRIRTEA